MKMLPIAASLAIALAGVAGTAQAQKFPSKPITLVVGFAPGGPTDAMARTLAGALRENLNESVIVDNKPGASSNIGAEHVARAKPDGYTIMLGTPAPLVTSTDSQSATWQVEVPRIWRTPSQIRLKPCT